MSNQIYKRQGSLAETIAGIERDLSELSTTQLSGRDVFTPKVSTVNAAVYDVAVHGQGSANGIFFYVRFQADTQTMPHARLLIAVYSDAAGLVPASANSLLLTTQFVTQDSIAANGKSVWFVNLYILTGAPITDAYAKLYVLGSDTGAVTYEV